MVTASYIHRLGNDEWAVMTAVCTLIITAWTLIYTYLHDRSEIRKNSLVLRNTLRLDFSRRYQDLITSMPDPPVFTDKYAGLYFDLCAEEYRLKGQGADMVDQHTWRLWKEGMESTLKDHPELLKHWQRSRRYYDSRLPNETVSFQAFFDGLTERLQYTGKPNQN